jgi:signal peptidase I
MTEQNPASQPRRDDDLWGFDPAIAPDPSTPVDAGHLPAEDKKKSSPIREIVETIILAAVIFVLVRAVVLNYRVDGHSMDPTLANNELLFVNRNAYIEFNPFFFVNWIPGVDVGSDVKPFGDPERGDIVVLTPPVDDKPYIKRVIGIAGDHIEIHDNGVYVNGARLDEDYVGGDDTFCGTNGGACRSYDVPEGFVYVLGDNRENSSDSRVFGLVSIGAITGKAWFTYWPVDYFGPVGHEDYPELDG